MGNVMQLSVRVARFQCNPAATILHIIGTKRYNDNKQNTSLMCELDSLLDIPRNRPGV